MGYRGKVQEQQRARELRKQSWTLQEIADELGVAKSSVSLWVRDVEFTPVPRETHGRARPGARRRGPSEPQRRKHAEIARLLADGYDRVGTLAEREFLMAGIALYAGEGAKTDGEVRFSNSDPRMIAFFCAWLRHFFDIDETRLRVRLYLHQGLDLDAANRFWADVTGIPVEQFTKPYRAVPDGGIRNSKHIYGCPGVSYSCSRTHRAIMGLIRAMLSPRALRDVG